MSEKIMGGSPEYGSFSEKKIDGREGANISLPTDEVNTISSIIYHTEQRGLEKLPGGFDANDGHWQTIKSDNPFEVLYLDYEQYVYITPEIVSKNFTILQAFWKEKFIALNGVARDRISKKYGIETINTSLEKLQKEYDKIRTYEGIQDYYKEINNKRIKKGIEALQEILDIVLEDGELTKNEANTIITKGLANRLKEEEVRKYLLDLIQEKGYKPRSTKKKDDVFDNQWMTDEKWKQAQTRTTSIFGHAVSTLEEIGEVLFYTREDANGFIKKYLLTEIVKMASSDKAMEFEKIIDDENDTDRRFLKVIYHLNPSLPFKIDEFSFNNIGLLFDETANNCELLQTAFRMYEKQYIHIWLKETDPVSAAKLVNYLSYNEFLRFVYRINDTHPFYINNDSYATPLDLIKSANTDKSLWMRIYEVMQDNEIFVWLSEIGKGDWVTKYNEMAETFIDSTFHDDNDKKCAAVQTLMQIIDPSLEKPVIVCNLNGIELLAIEGSHTIQQPLQFSLQNTGFVKAMVYLDNEIDGVYILENEILFFGQAGQTVQNITLDIAALELIKNKEYATNIIVETIYEKLTIPVKLRAVFPKNAFIIMLVKYSVITAFILGAFRYGLSYITNHNTWLSEDNILRNYFDFNTSANLLPPYYFVFVLCMVALLVIIYKSFSVIKKFEKL